MGGIETGARETTLGGGGSREERLWVLLRRSWIPQGPRSEISFRCAWGRRGNCWTWEFKIQKMGPGSHLFGGQRPLPKGTCPGLGVGGGALGGQKGGTMVIPPEVFVSNLVPRRPNARGLGAPPLPPSMSAIMESQNTKTHSSERTDTVCSLESRNGHDPFTRGGKERKKKKKGKKRNAGKRDLAGCSWPALKNPQCPDVGGQQR